MLFIDQLRAMGYSLEIPLEQAKQLFSEINDIWDRTSLKAYFGTLPGESEREIEREAVYASGTRSKKTIYLRQKIAKTKGYLEKLNLVSYERHGKVWFIVLENPQIVPIIVKANKSIDKISLAPIPHSPVSVERSEENHLILGSRQEQENGCPKLLPKINNNNLQGEREISQLPLEAYPSILQAYSNLTEEEYSILHSALVERDRLKCLDCGKIDASNPYKIWCPRGKGERTRQDVCSLEGGS